MTSREGKNPVFSTLTPEECWAVLSRNHIGRLAFMNANRVDIEPVSYVAEDPWLFMRSAEGAKLEAISHSPYVAFEVDEVKTALDWRSVVARGTIYLLADDERHVDRETVERAIDALRSIQPHAFRNDDPTPFRRTIYGVHVDLLTGRTAQLAVGPSSPQPIEPTHRTPRPRTADGF